MLGIEIGVSKDIKEIIEKVILILVGVFFYFLYIIYIGFKLVVCVKCVV